MAIVFVPMSHKLAIVKTLDVNARQYNVLTCGWNTYKADLYGLHTLCISSKLCDHCIKLE